MSDNDFIKISKDCDGILIPSGDQIKLKKGTPVKITQSLGGYFTLYVNGNLVNLGPKEYKLLHFFLTHQKTNIL